MRGNEGDKKQAEPQIPATDIEGLIIEPSDLLPGDILLFHSLSGKPPAKQIRKATGSPYTHAAIYLGDGKIAESNVPRVGIRNLLVSDLKDNRIGVLRSQMGFTGERAAAVREFAEELVAQKAAYDLSGVLTFKGRHKKFHENVLAAIAKNYGTVKSADELVKESYFCSAFVVACYMVAGIIGDSAQVAYPPDVISPGDLHRDATFGWLLGFLKSDGTAIPADDPLLCLTFWKDNLAIRWW